MLAGVLLLSLGLPRRFLFLQMRSQMDNYAVQDIETVEGLLYFDAGGRVMLREDYHNHRSPSRCWNGWWRFGRPSGQRSLSERTARWSGPGR